MNLKAALKYQLNEYKKPVIIYYIVILALFITGFTLTTIFPGGSNVMAGLEGASVIFLFVVGLNSFKDSSKMLLQNGVSRRTQFKAIVLGIIVVSLTMLVIDTLVQLLSVLVLPYANSFTGVFVEAYFNKGTFSASLNPVLWQFGGYMLAAFIGLGITTLYVRLRKGWKIAVSISVPVFFFIVVPVLAERFNIRLLRPIINFVKMIFGVNPYLDSLLLFVTCAIAAAICFLMSRKAKFE